MKILSSFTHAHALTYTYISLMTYDLFFSKDLLLCSAKEIMSWFGM